jgi:hypothetical protein
LDVLLQVLVVVQHYHHRHINDEMEGLGFKNVRLVHTQCNVPGGGATFRAHIFIRSGPAAPHRRHCCVVDATTPAATTPSTTSGFKTWKVLWDEWAAAPRTRSGTAAAAAAAAGIPYIPQAALAKASSKARCKPRSSRATKGSSSKHSCKDPMRGTSRKAITKGKGSNKGRSKGGSQGSCKGSSRGSSSRGSSRGSNSRDSSSRDSNKGSNKGSSMGSNSRDSSKAMISKTSRRVISKSKKLTVRRG